MNGFLRQIETGKDVGIIDADLLGGGTRHPNLALMKLSGYCKSQGCNVSLVETYEGLEKYDLVFVSKVFTFTWSPPDLAEKDNVYIGGTGFFTDGGENLPSAIEHHMPDYDLYRPYVERKISEGRSRSWYADYLDYSIGFTTRGCFRKCSFCVNKKYDHAFRHSPISEFLDTSRPYIYLWDDNFFAYPKWEEVLDELIATGKPFQFRQGLDIRLMDAKKAKKLRNVRYVGDFIFAFDHIEDRELIEKKLAIWRKYTVRGTRLYVLCAYDSQDEHDIVNTFERIRILMKYGCLPYIMRYEDYKHSKWKRLYVNIARWCNQPQFFKKMSFRQFCEKNQKYHKNQGTLCSAMQSMTDFEQEFPYIAAEYFDLIYEEQNMMIRLGRKFFGKPNEDISRTQTASWQHMREGALSNEELLQSYFDKDLDIAWAESYGNQDYTAEEDLLFDTIMGTPLDDIFDIVSSSGYSEPIGPENIPQYSSLDSLADVAFVLSMLGETVTMENLGCELMPNRRGDTGANRKYGENHGKLASMLDLATYERNATSNGFKGTHFSQRYVDLTTDEKKQAIARLSFRIPIIRQMLVDARDGEVSLGDYMVTLSESTKKRRRPNVMKIIDLIKEAGGTESSVAQAAANIGRDL